MEVLFVCRANVGRSQMAPAFFNQLAREHHATGAGTHVFPNQGQKLHEYVIASMHEVGIDLETARTQQLTQEMVEKADKVIVMTEASNLPDYVSGAKVELWSIPDAKDKDLEFHRRIRDDIHRQVKALILSLNV